MPKIFTSARDLMLLEDRWFDRYWSPDKYNPKEVDVASHEWQLTRALLLEMKQVALGRKAWLFVGNVEAGERSAMMMTLVSSAKRHDLDVGLYIKDVLDQLLAGCTDYHSLLPDQWKQRHPEAIREYRQEERRNKADRKQVQAAKRRLARKRRQSV